MLQKWFKLLLQHRPIGSTHVFSWSSLSRGLWNRAIYARYTDSLGQKITTCIIAHRPIRFTSRCAISGFVSLGQNESQEWSHIDRFDSPVEVRYLIFAFSWPENHNMHHRTSTDSIHQSMCDIWVLYLLAKTNHKNDRTSTIVANKNCAISGPPT